MQVDLKEARERLTWAWSAVKDEFSGRGLFGLATGLLGAVVSATRELRGKVDYAGTYHRQISAMHRRKGFPPPDAVAIARSAPVGRRNRHDALKF